MYFEGGVIIMEFGGGKMARGIGIAGRNIVLDCDEER